MWWLWTAFDPVLVHKLNVLELHNVDDDDVAWLGEYGWTGITDNMGLGLLG